MLKNFFCFPSVLLEYLQFRNLLIGEFDPGIFALASSKQIKWGFEKGLKRRLVQRFNFASWDKQADFISKGITMLRRYLLAVHRTGRTGLTWKKKEELASALGLWRSKISCGRKYHAPVIAVH